MNFSAMPSALGERHLLSYLLIGLRGDSNASTSILKMCVVILLESGTWGESFQSNEINFH